MTLARSVPRVLFVALCLLGSLARGESRGILLLGIQQQAKPSEAARTIIASRLTDLGKIDEERALLRVRPLGVKEAGRRADPRSAAWMPKLETCKDRNKDCLAWLAEREQVGTIIGGSITETRLSEERSTYAVQLWLYEAASGKLVERTGDCEECQRDGLAPVLRGTTGKLFDRGGAGESVQRPRTCPECPPCVQEPCIKEQPVPVGPVGPAPRLSRGRKAGAAIFGTGLFLSLGASFALAYLHGTKVNDTPFPCSEQPMPQTTPLRMCNQVIDSKYIAIPLSTATVSAIGMIISLVPPEPAGRER